MLSGPAPREMEQCTEGKRLVTELDTGLSADFKSNKSHLQLSLQSLPTAIGVRPEEPRHKEGVPCSGPMKSMSRKQEPRGLWAMSSAVSFLFSLRGPPRADVE